MTIQLINQEKYDLLLKIQKENPILTFQNNGYEYIDKSKFTEEDRIAFNKVTDILNAHITGFRKFNNFTFNKNGELRVRFQYDYSADSNSQPFEGVGYLSINELLNGFKNKEDDNIQ